MRDIGCFKNIGLAILYLRNKYSALNHCLLDKYVDQCIFPYSYCYGLGWTRAPNEVIFAVTENTNDRSYRGVTNLLLLHPSAVN